ncbi:DUF883 family protein [Singulisphaera sp. PoT]|uniref:DUF883 family protein n=1 Tax=Singulisphaera sp. PoT TaxID=3411797 RepID=UPI003BF56C7C
MADPKDKAKDAIDEGAAQAKKATDSVADKVGGIAGNVREYAEQAGAQFQHQYEDVADRAREGYRQASGMVRENPAQSVALAFGLGISLGLVLGLALRSDRS